MFYNLNTLIISIIEKLLVFDLDETLIHCIFNDEDIHDADVFLDIKIPNQKSVKTGFNIRPYWKELMDSVKNDWEIAVFTASCQNYADTILDYLDPENEYFKNRFYRETCWKSPEGVYIKDLRVFTQWEMSNIILVDNAVYSFGFQLDNGIPIFPYIQGKDDKQLLYLKEYLQVINKNNVIKDLKKTFKMKELYESDIDSFLDYYGESEDSDEVPNDQILDQMLSSESFSRIKGKSFYVTKGSQFRFTSESNVNRFSFIHENKSDNSLLDDTFQRTTSANNIGSIEEVNSNPFEDQIVDCTSSNNSQKEVSKNDNKVKQRKRKLKLQKLK